jgi:hypothetical protein
MTCGCVWLDRAVTGAVVFPVFGGILLGLSLYRGRMLNLLGMLTGRWVSGGRWVVVPANGKDRPRSNGRWFTLEYQ